MSILPSDSDALPDPLASSQNTHQVASLLAGEVALSVFPQAPGVYFFYDDDHGVLYVGKAKNLRKRLANYLSKQHNDIKTRVLMRHAVSVSFTITATENEALILESQCIKAHRPRYNVLMKDDKSYPYLSLSVDAPFPRLDYCRRKQGRSLRYFGPYPDARSARESLTILQKLFQLRQCSDHFFKARKRPCLQYQIARCTAPCVGLVSPSAYRQQVEDAALFLSGKPHQIIKNMRAKMTEAANAQVYERARLYRDEIKKLEYVRRQDQKEGFDDTPLDVLAVLLQGRQVCLILLVVRAGKLFAERCFFFTLKAQDFESAAVCLSDFMSQYYLQSELLGGPPARVLVSESVPDRDWIESALSQRLGAGIKVIQTGPKPYIKWLEMAKRNAAYRLAERTSVKVQVQGRLEALGQRLGVAQPIKHIECFDISHTQGEETMASCVVYGAEGAMKKAYRTFRIQGVTPGDDLAAMRQALEKHYSGCLAREEPLPDVVMVDGGPRQLDVALGVMSALSITSVRLLAIGKGKGRKPGLETILCGAHHHCIDLGPYDSALHLLQFIRDESHRVALSAHRKRRGKKALSSGLEGVRGLGPVRKQSLLLYFKGIRGIKSASLAELKAVPGLGPQVAEALYKQLHPREKG
jgi:excinuclease ABC subunit C